MSESAGSIVISARPLSSLSASRHPSRVRSRSGSSARTAALQVAGLGHQGGVRRLVAHRRPGVDELLHHGGPHVLEQLGHRGVRRPGERELLGVAEPVEHRLDRRPGAEQHQPADAEPVPGVALVLAAEDGQPHGGALVDEAGEALHLVPGPHLGERRLDRAERPGRLAGAGQAGVGGHGRHRLRELRAQRLLERLEVLAAALLAAGVVDHAVGGAQVLGHLAPVPGLAGHHDPGGGAAPALERVEQRLLARRGGREEVAGPVGGRHEADPQVLGQAADQAGDQLEAQARHVPGEVVGHDPVEGGDRHVDREPVVGGAGLEVVADREGQPAATGRPRGDPLLRVVGLLHLRDGVVGEHREVEGRAGRAARGGPASTTGRSGRR